MKKLLVLFLGIVLLASMALAECGKSSKQCDSIRAKLPCAKKCKKLCVKDVCVKTKDCDKCGCPAECQKGAAKIK
ncbi:MAG: hypothetical protein KKC80_07715 [Candidatus Margulisbacteria bacterium]|nr:hypothetical protein [Candidatus Margulisiibacteriota bacterium]MBU1617237.1 hypothetical protein [Candidatus Margulisiibacteriota bacterium]MBU1867277.1 hypothetical protein [Candidatus Margulisiibacteriota bacterium]